MPGLIDLGNLKLIAARSERLEVHVEVSRLFPLRLLRAHETVANACVLRTPEREQRHRDLERARTPLHRSAVGENLRAVHHLRECRWARRARGSILRRNQVAQAARGAD